MLEVKKDSNKNKNREIYLHKNFMNLKARECYYCPNIKTS